MALAEALKSNNTLKELKSAALPPNPPTHAFSLHSVHTRCTRSFSPFLCRVRRLSDNKLGPEGGMALAEALKSNTTLETLESAALPSNPLPIPLSHTARTFSALAPSHPSFAVCAGSATTSLAPRVAWRSPRRSRATRPSRSSSLLPCHRIHSPVHSFRVFHPLPRSLDASQEHPIQPAA